jgi:hypothetical protein
MVFWQVKVGSIPNLSELDYEDDDDDDDDDDDGFVRRHIHDDGSEDKHSVLQDDKRGFVFSGVTYSDDDTYKCEAKKQNQKEVMYFYLHVGK